MENKWSDDKAFEFITKYGRQWGEDLALRICSSRLLGREKGLVLHGGGNTSVKSTYRNIFGDSIPALYVKASGLDMADIGPDGHPGLDLNYLLRMRELEELSNESMVNELRTHLFDFKAATPSIEALLHAFIPEKYIDHVHADAVLALTNQTNGEELARDALGDDIIVLAYVKAGFRLAKAAADAYDANPNARAMVLMSHGLVTWGETAHESHDAVIELVTRAENYLASRTSTLAGTVSSVSTDVANVRLAKAAPMIRGKLVMGLQNNVAHGDRFVLLPLINQEVLRFLNAERGKDIALTPPLTPDHLIRTKAMPLWVDSPNYDDLDQLCVQISQAIDRYAEQYNSYVDRYSEGMKAGVCRFDPMPRVIMMPGLGVLCAGRDATAAGIVRDITAQAIAVKSSIAGMGSYNGLSEKDLFSMEYYSLQHAKLDKADELSLSGRVGLVTGAAGAIGSGICRGLLQQGCHVAVTDLPGPNLEGLVDELRSDYRDRVIGVPLDVTDPDSVSDGIAAISQTWGGVDIAVINAGVALVSKLADMDIESFRRLERINIEGTLNIFREMAHHFKLQGIGGDVVLISTKNVFSPGAEFGAYSATKAASHQIARIASLEMADMGVRVNMVAPDAVFSDGLRKSGLWQEVGPGRMKARGLDEEGLEEYYRSRNLLKEKITADHVANAVIFFATRQTPTTGATIPVDGGLPDATPR